MDPMSSFYQHNLSAIILAGRCAGRCTDVMEENLLFLVLDVGRCRHAVAAKKTPEQSLRGLCCGPAWPLGT